MNATVHNLGTKPAPRKAPAKAKSEKKVSAKVARRLHWQHKVGLGLAAIACGMTAVSLSHIANGVEHLTNGMVPAWQSWAVAVGLDANYIGMELAAVIAALQHTRDRLHKFTRFGVPAIMGFSMAMNAFEFSNGAANVPVAIAMGVVLPAIVWVGFRIALILSDV